MGVVGMGQSGRRVWRVGAWGDERVERREEGKL